MSEPIEIIIEAGSLEQWWREKANEEIERTLPKVKEYSAKDLEIMGAAMLGFMPKTVREVMGGLTAVPMPDSIGIEAAIMFYILGKVSRAIGAYQEGRLPSEDTLFDIGVYARMAQRVRETGAWPGE